MNIKKILSILCVVLVVMLGLSVLFIFLNMRNYYPLRGEELIGIVYCEREKTKTFLRFERIMENKVIRRVDHTLNSDEWILTVEVLKWADFLGLVPFYRVARIGDEERSDCIDPGLGSLWSFLIKHPKIIPFLQAIKGEVSLPIPEETTRYYIYIRESGLMVECLSKPKRLDS